MATYHYFRSERRADQHAFADDRSGARLPPEYGPWRLVRTVDPSEGWTREVDRAAAAAGITMNGYYLFESDTELTFDETPTRSRDFE